MLTLQNSKNDWQIERKRRRASQMILEPDNQSSTRFKKSGGGRLVIVNYDWPKGWPSVISDRAIWLNAKVSPSKLKNFLIQEGVKTSEVNRIFADKSLFD